MRPNGLGWQQLEKLREESKQPWIRRGAGPFSGTRVAGWGPPVQACLGSILLVWRLPARSPAAAACQRPTVPRLLQALPHGCTHLVASVCPSCAPPHVHAPCVHQLKKGAISQRQGGWTGVGFCDRSFEDGRLFVLKETASEMLSTGQHAALRDGVSRKGRDASEP